MLQQQAKYDIFERPLEIDEMLQTNEECQRKAQGLLDYLKQPPQQLTLKVSGNPKFKLGDRQLVQIPNDGIDAYYRIVRINHAVIGTDYVTTLELELEGEYIEAMFLILRRTLDLLEKMQKYA